MAMTPWGRISVLLGVTALGLLCVTTAKAALEGPPPGTQPGERAAADVAPGLGDKAEAGPPEVVVTATRQSKALSKVPENVSAFTAVHLETLAVKSFADLAKFTPGGGL